MHVFVNVAATDKEDLITKKETSPVADGAQQVQQALH